MSPERERKRKRDTNGVPRPVPNAKPTPFDQTVKLHHKPPTECPPILASVHGVELPKDIKLNGYTKRVTATGPKGLLVRKSELALRGQTQRIEYSGSEEDDGLSYYVGVYDPATKSVDVYPAHLLHVRHTVRRLKEKEIPEKASAGTLLDSRQALSAAFGNRTSRKQLMDEQLNAITDSTLGETAGESVVSAIASAVGAATAALPTSESLRVGAGNSKYLPPVHAEETKIENIYRLDEMVEKRVLESCRTNMWEKAISEGLEGDSTTSPHYVSPRIRQIIESGDKVTQRLQLLRFIEHLIQFHRIFIAAHSNTLFKGKIYETFEADDKSITAHLIETFTDAVNQNKSSRQLGKTKLTKLYCWLIILCLKVEEDGKMDLWDLVQDLQIDRKEVEMATREIGARVKPFPEKMIQVMGFTKEEAREHKLASLELPLSWPRNKMPPKRGRK